MENDTHAKNDDEWLQRKAELQVKALEVHQYAIIA